MTVERVTADKKRYLDLLLLADPCEAMVDRYLELGEMYVLRDEDGEAACECVLLERSDGAIELKNIATAPDKQRRGYAGFLLEEAARLCGGRYRRMYVGTAGAEHFYESHGFVYEYTYEEFFSIFYPEPVIDGDLVCVDMVYLVREL